MLVGDPRAEADDERAAAVRVRGEVRRLRVRHDEVRRRDHDAIAGEIVLRADEVDRQPERAECSVPREEDLEVGDRRR